MDIVTDKDFQVVTEIRSYQFLTYQLQMDVIFQRMIPQSPATTLIVDLK